jgi:hypothetical protein
MAYFIGGFHLARFYIVNENPQGSVVSRITGRTPVLY